MKETWAVAIFGGDGTLKLEFVVLENGWWKEALHTAFPELCGEYHLDDEYDRAQYDAERQDFQFEVKKVPR